MKKVIRNDEIGLLLFLPHGDDNSPPWPDSPGRFVGCADAYVQVSDFLDRPRCIGTLRVYVRENYPSPAFVLDELADELLQSHMLWHDVVRPVEACLLRIVALRTVWIEVEEPGWFAPEEESALRDSVLKAWDDPNDQEDHSHNVNKERSE